ncbi:MAG: alpha/beta hydrolase [Pseudomonadota bacterium]
MGAIRSKILRLAVILAITYGAAVAALFVFQDQMLFPAQNASALQFDERFEQIDIVTGDGETLKALFLAGNDKKPIVVRFHGNASAPVFERDTAIVLQEAGFGTLLTTYRGYGGSTGEPSAAGLKLDALAAVDWAAARSAKRPAIYAHSLGTGLAVHAATEREVGALVLEAPYDELVEVAAGLYPWAPVRTLFRHNIAPVDQISSLNLPVLMLHGNRDDIIPIRHGQALAEAGGGNVEFVTLDGAAHNNLQRYGSLARAVEFFTELPAE